MNPEEALEKTENLHEEMKIISKALKEKNRMLWARLEVFENR